MKIKIEWIKTWKGLIKRLGWLTFIKYMLILIQDCINYISRQRSEKNNELIDFIIPSYIFSSLVGLVMNQYKWTDKLDKHKNLKTFYIRPWIKTEGPFDTYHQYWLDIFFFKYLFDLKLLKMDRLHRESISLFHNSLSLFSVHSTK